MKELNKIYNEDCLVGMQEIEDKSIDCIICDLPYNMTKLSWKYRLIWEKNVPTGMASAKTRPMKYFEEICVFNKGKSTYNPIMKERVGIGKACYNYNHYCGDSNHLKLDKKPKSMTQILCNQAMYCILTLYQIVMENYIQHKNQLNYVNT